MNIAPPPPASPNPDAPAPWRNAFWDYALALYARPDVSPACLALQHHAGMDVPLLLYVLYCARCGHALDAAAIAQADAAVRPWREQAILPLRHIRQRIKPGVAGVPASWLEPVRQDIKRQELQAEQLSMALLHALRLHQPLAPPQPPDLTAVVQHFLALQQRPAHDLELPQLQSALQTLLAQDQALARAQV